MKYLFNKSPLVVDKDLAVVIGLKEAMILQQMQYWLNKSSHNYNGKTWIYNSINEWAKQFPFFSESTIIRAIRKLETDGLLFIGNYNKDKRDRTKWYSINYQKLEELMENASIQDDERKYSDCTDANSQNDQMRVVNLNTPLPEITTETTTETTTDIITQKPQTKKSKSFCELPDDFKPNENHKELANQKQVNLFEEFQKFKDYCLANAKKYKDWNAALNNWIRNASSFAESRALKTNRTKKSNDLDFSDTSWADDIGKGVL